MSGSGAGEMALTSSKAVVFPKFHMHVYTSELTSSDFEAAVANHLIHMDLHPRLPPLGMTMDKLPSCMDTFLKLPTWTRTIVSNGLKVLGFWWREWGKVMGSRESSGGVVRSGERMLQVWREI
nr:hypothetical protein [Tanacetum cinerariifolium]